MENFIFCVGCFTTVSCLTRRIISLSFHSPFFKYGTMFTALTTYLLYVGSLLSKLLEIMFLETIWQQDYIWKWYRIVFVILLFALFSKSSFFKTFDCIGILKILSNIYHGDFLRKSFRIKTHYFCKKLKYAFVLLHQNNFERSMNKSTQPREREVAKFQHFVNQLGNFIKTWYISSLLVSRLQLQNDAFLSNITYGILFNLKQG